MKKKYEKYFIHTGWYTIVILPVVWTELHYEIFFLNLFIHYHVYFVYKISEIY